MHPGLIAALLVVVIGAATAIILVARSGGGEDSPIAGPAATETDTGPATDEPAPTDEPDFPPTSAPPTTAAPSASPRPTAAGDPAPMTTSGGQLGTPVTIENPFDDDVVLTVHRYGVVESTDRFTQPEGAFLGVEITVDLRALSNPDIGFTMDSWDFGVQLSDGSTADNAWLSPLPDLVDFGIAPGQSSTGFVYFDIPVGAVPTALVYEPFLNLYGLPPAPIALR